MLRILIASHAHFASGIKSAAELLLGPNDRITTYDAYVDQSSIKDKFDEYFQTVDKDDQVLLLSDVLGGSVNQMMFRYLDRPNTTLITGINLSLVLELALREEISEEEIDLIVAESKKVLCIVRRDGDPTTEVSGEGTDFF